MKKAAMNRRKRLDAPSKQESRERYENARRQNPSRKDESKEDLLSSTSELPKRPREDSDKDDNSDLREKIPKLSRTIAGNDETGSLVINVGKSQGSSAFSLVDPSYGVEKFDYSHKRTDVTSLEERDDDLRSIIERQRKTDPQSEATPKKSDKNPKKSGSAFHDSALAHGKDHKTKSSSDYRDSKRKDSKDSRSSSGKTDKYSKHDKKSDESKYKNKKVTGESPSGFELGIPFFSSSVSGSKSEKPAKEMDINETLKELAYLRSIQTGENALPKEEEEYFRKLNDLSKTSVTSPLDLLLTGKESEKLEGGKKPLVENLGQSETKWDRVIDNMIGTNTTTKALVMTSNDETTYGPSLPPKKPTLTSKNTQRSSPTERRLSKSDFKAALAIRGVRGGRGFRGRGVRGSFRGHGRGRGRGRGRGGKEFGEGTRGRGGRGLSIRGGFMPNRGRHIFAKQGSSKRRSRSRSSSQSSSSSRSRSGSRSHGRSRNKRRRHRSSSRSSYSSSSYSRSRSHSPDRSRGRRQTRRRSRSYSRSKSHTRSRSPSRSRGSHRKQSKDRGRSRSKSSSRSRSRKRKDRSRSWSFDEDYTKKKTVKSAPNTSAAKITDSKDKTKREPETKAQSKPRKEAEKELTKAKHNKEQIPKQVQKSQGKTKISAKNPENAKEKAPKVKPKAENPNSPAVVAMKDLKVTASLSNVFLPRTVTKTVGKITKGMSIAKGRVLPLKTHPVFDTPEDEIKEEPEEIDPKELKRIKEEKNRFDKEVDKVFNAAYASKEKDKKTRGTWTRVWPEEIPNKDEPEIESKEQKVEMKEKKEVESKVTKEDKVTEGRDMADEKKAEKDQKKEKKEKKRKEKEEKSKKKKEKKEKREKKNKESNDKETLGNENGNVGQDQSALHNKELEQFSQEGFEGYTDYSESYQEYPEGEYQDYSEAGQEQGWYDESGVYHAYEEEEYLYYYDQEGNIVGYEGPEGYVEGNPFEEQQSYYEEEQQGVEQPEVYQQEGYAAEYIGQYQYGAVNEQSYTHPVEADGSGEEQFTVDGSQWEGYPAETVEPQWYGAEGCLPEGGEGYTEYQYAEAQEGYHHPSAVEQAVQEPQGGANYMDQQAGTMETNAASARITEEPKSEGVLSENELVSMLGKNLAALARLKGWDQQDPTILTQLLQNPIEKPPNTSIQKENPPQKPQRQYQHEGKSQVPPERNIDPPTMQFPQEYQNPEDNIAQHPQERRPSSFRKARVAETKPLKSILKKANSGSLKPPPKTETTTAGILGKSELPGSAASDHVGPEYIVQISKTGPERFFCKLCQCHIESPMAKDLHVKSMKHIELFVREKSTLLHSVIGGSQAEDKDIASEMFPDSSIKSSTSSHLGNPQEKAEETVPQVGDKGFGQEQMYSEDRGTPGEVAERNKLLDYDRLRLRDWHRREESGSTMESERVRQFDYKRKGEQDNDGSTTVKERDLDPARKEQALRRPDDSRSTNWRHGEPHERDHHYPSEYEKGGYHRERQSLSHDSDRQDDQASVGSRGSDRSVGTERDSYQHRSQYSTYKDRMQHDVRTQSREDELRPHSARDRPRDEIQGVESQQKDYPSRQGQVPGKQRTERPSQMPHQERKKPYGDTRIGQDNRRGGVTQENRRQTPQSSRQDGGRQAPPQSSNRPFDSKGPKPSAPQAGSRNNRIPSTEKKEAPRPDLEKGKLNEKLKFSTDASCSVPEMERNQALPSQTSNRVNTSRDFDGKRHSDPSVERDRTSSQKPPSNQSSNVGLKSLAQTQNVTHDGKRRARETPQKNVPAAGLTSPGALLGDQPGQYLQDKTAQEPVKSISTVIQGQRRVPPPPPPYNKGSGPQSFRGRGHPLPHGSRGGHRPHMPPSQPEMTRIGGAPPPRSLLQMPLQGSPAAVSIPGGMPHRDPFPGGPSTGGHSAPPFFGVGRSAGHPQFHGRGGGPSHVSRGGRGGPQQFPSRGRGGRGFHGQRW